MNELIRNIYSYTEEERSTFAYIDRYMNCVFDTPHISDTGFALAGMFLTYRACNHSSIRMSTSLNEIQFPQESLHYSRLAEFTALTGLSFCGSAEYLRLARVNPIRLFLSRPHRLLLRIAKTHH